MSLRQLSACALRNPHRARVLSSHQVRVQSTTTRPPFVDVAALLAEPSWSVRSLFGTPASTLAPEITKSQLHHLLRLSALPLPETEAQEAKMIKDLQAQLSFVQAIQEIDTEGVEPLESIRDETEEGKRENTVTLEMLKDELAKEEIVGKRGRIRRRKGIEKGEERKKEGQAWDPLQHAAKTRGQYFVVDTAKD